MKNNVSSNEYLLALEKSLKSKLHPIAPDQKFVWSLRERLEDLPTFRKQQTIAVTLLSVAAGLVVGLGIFLIGREFLHEADEA